MKPGKRRWARKAFRAKIRNILLAYYLTPILLVSAASGVSFYYFAKRSLDQELGKRLSSVALATTYHVFPFQIDALNLFDSTTQTYASMKSRFLRIQKDHHLARIFLFDRDNRTLLDSDAEMSPGEISQSNQLHASEVRKAWNGEVTATVLFQGHKGDFFKGAFAPVLHNGKVLAVVGVEGNAGFFENLYLLGRRLVLFGFGFIILIVVVSVLISRRIVYPIQSLVSHAQRIGEGHLDAPVTPPSQNELGFLGFVMDEMRKGIVARDRDLQMMMKGIAHEVRNPLGGIELFAGILEEDVTTDHGKNAVRKIRDEVRNLKKLIEEFLDFGRNTAMQMKRTPIRTFFEDLETTLRSELHEKNQNVHIDVDADLAVEMDSDQMRRAFLNLVHNSMQASPAGSTIILGAHSDGNQTTLWVKDAGVGISKENLELIFDPFFTTKEKGSGLGLSFARKIVTAHGGEIRMESKVGEGTSVFVVLPV